MLYHLTQPCLPLIRSIFRELVTINNLYFYEDLSNTTTCDFPRWQIFSLMPHVSYALIVRQVVVGCVQCSWSQAMLLLFREHTHILQYHESVHVNGLIWIRLTANIAYITILVLVCTLYFQTYSGLPIKQNGSVWQLPFSGCNKYYKENTTLTSNTER